MNKIMLIGNIGGEPEIINLESGSKIAKFSLATNESYKNKQGEKVQETEWHNIVVFGKQADIVENYFTKGMKVYVGGKTKTRKWQNQQGENRYATEVQMREFEFLGDYNGGSNTQQAPHVDDSDADYNDEMPF
jgi:single-strand DNA-binding protein